mmetsp:Transcript_21308/g.49474  ORF Transcript_21308/g.49474 Transcript_21308/m.49474 type:complete len:226 (-) Transcript_21308:910-1587(-)
MCLDRIDPRITNPITKLFLLSPQHFLGQVCSVTRQVEGLPEDPFLDSRLARRIPAHLLLRVETHRHLHESAVKERYSAFYTPGKQCLVGSQAVVQVKLTHLADVLFVELLGVWGLVEIEVSAKNFVSAFATQDHLHTHGPNASCHQIHWGRSPNSGNIERFEVVNDIVDGVYALLGRECILMVDTSDEVGNLARSSEIGAAFQTYAKGVELWPIGRFSPIRLNSP